MRPAPDDPRAIDPVDLWGPRLVPTATVRARVEDKEVFLTLHRELMVALGRPLRHSDTFALLVAFAEGDTAGFLGWAARQAP